MLMVLGLIGIRGPDWLWLLVAGSLAGAIAGMPYGLRYRSRIALAAITGAAIVWGLGFRLDPNDLALVLSGLVIIGGTVAGGLAACRAAVCPGDGLVLPFVETPW